MVTKTFSLSYDDYVKGLHTLTPEEQLSLLDLISANLKTIIMQKKSFAGSKLANLKWRQLIKGDPDDLVDMKVWEWNESESLITSF